MFAYLLLGLVVAGLIVFYFYKRESYITSRRKSMKLPIKRKKFDDGRLEIKKYLTEFPDKFDDINYLLGDRRCAICGKYRAMNSFYLVINNDGKTYSPICKTCCEKLNEWSK